MKHGMRSFQALVLVGIVVGVGLAISGGPVVWAVLVMISPPLLAVYLLAGSRRAGPNPHFASAPRPAAQDDRDKPRG